MAGSTPARAAAEMLLVQRAAGVQDQVAIWRAEACPVKAERPAE